MKMEAIHDTAVAKYGMDTVSRAIALLAARDMAHLLTPTVGEDSALSTLAAVVSGVIAGLEMAEAERVMACQQLLVDLSAVGMTQGVH